MMEVVSRMTKINITKTIITVEEKVEVELEDRKYLAILYYFYALLGKAFSNHLR